MMRYMIDYSQKMEKTLKELRSLLKPTGDQPEQAGTGTLPPCNFPVPDRMVSESMACLPPPPVARLPVGFPVVASPVEG